MATNISQVSARFPTGYCLRRPRADATLDEKKEAEGADGVDLYWLAWFDLATEEVPVISSHVNWAVGLSDICGEGKFAHAPACLLAHGCLEVCRDRGSLLVTDACLAVNCDPVGSVEHHPRRDNPVRRYSSRHRAMRLSNWDITDERLPRP